MGTLVPTVILARPAEPPQVEGDGRLGRVAVRQVAAFETVLEGRIPVTRGRERDGDEGEDEQHHRQAAPGHEGHVGGGGGVWTKPVVNEGYIKARLGDLVINAPLGRDG